MAEKNTINGWINLDKPAGLSSTQAMAKVRRALNADKAGHGGTLDPFATGVLPIALGEATKLINYVMDGEKEYAFTAVWGEAKDTDDYTGKVIATSDVRPSEKDIRAALGGFIGAIQQTPPQFSAIHVDGQRAYDLAREGKEVELAPREVQVHGFDLISCDGPDEASFKVTCGKGTYIRSLARDLAEKLGTRAHVKTLKRLKTGPFTYETTISLESLQEMGHNSAVLPLTAVLDDIPALAVSALEAGKLRQGQMVAIPPTRIIDQMKTGSLIPTRDAYGLVALCEWDAPKLKPARVFKPQV